MVIVNQNQINTNKCKGLKSKYNNNKIAIIATVVPTICNSTLPCSTKLKTIAKTIKFELADGISNSDNPVQGINLLIGQDNYWKFNTTEEAKINDNLAAVKTFFGV